MRWDSGKTKIIQTLWDKKLPLNAFLREGVSDATVKARLRALVEGGYVVVEEGLYKIKSKRKLQVNVEHLKLEGWLEGRDGLRVKSLSDGRLLTLSPVEKGGYLKLNVLKRGALQASFPIYNPYTFYKLCDIEEEKAKNFTDAPQPPS